MSFDEILANNAQAKLWCSEYGDGSWRLPEINELIEIYVNMSVLNTYLSIYNESTLGTGQYWSSTMEGSDWWVFLYFSSGNIGTLYKGNPTNTKLTRAVRAL